MAFDKARALEVLEIVDVNMEVALDMLSSSLVIRTLLLLLLLHVLLLSLLLLHVLLYFYYMYFKKIKLNAQSSANGPGLNF